MNITAVIVTYNRIDKLKHALECYEKQTILPSLIIVVDNASTDGTNIFLHKWEKEESKFDKIVINLANNEGGSGGFYIGLTEALNHRSEWIWVSDDDAYPDKDAFRNAVNYLNNRSTEKISAICGKVVTKGIISKDHRKNIKIKGLKIIEELCNEDEYSNDEFELNGFSYVGTLLNKKMLILAGVTIKDYFIWRDDTEHSLRLSKLGKIKCIPSIIIEHDVDESNDNLSWKDYYGYRNTLDMYRRHLPFLCYKWLVLKKSIKSIYLSMFAINKEYALLYKTALIDAKKIKLGINHIYKPGWIPDDFEKK